MRNLPQVASPPSQNDDAAHKAVGLLTLHGIERNRVLRSVMRTT